MPVHQYWSKKSIGLDPDPTPDPEPEPEKVINVADFDSLEDAIAALEPGAILRLAGDVALGANFMVDQETTVDLNGSQLSGNGSRYLAVRSGGKLTVKDSSQDGTGAIVNNSAAVRVIGGGEFTLESGLIKSTASSAIQVGQKTAPGGTVTINGGKVEAQEVGILATYEGAKVIVNDGELTTVDNFVVGGNGSEGQGDTDITINGGVLNGNITSGGYIACGIYHPQRGSLTINGGEINANGGVGICLRGGELTINGGTINATGDASLTGKVGDSGVAVPVTGIAIDKQAKYYDADNMLVTITDGNVFGVKSAIEPILADDQSVEGQVEITGGTFSHDVTEFVADGHTCTQENDQWKVA